MGQEPGSNAEIKAFQESFGAKWQMFEKSDVNGENTHPVYKFLRVNSELYCAKDKTSSEIPWNFAKFLVNHEGRVIGYWGPSTDLD